MKISDFIDQRWSKCNATLKYNLEYVYCAYLFYGSSMVSSKYDWTDPWVPKYMIKQEPAVGSIGSAQDRMFLQKQVMCLESQRTQNDSNWL